MYSHILKKYFVFHCNFSINSQFNSHVQSYIIISVNELRFFDETNVACILIRSRSIFRVNVRTAGISSSSSSIVHISRSMYVTLFPLVFQSSFLHFLVAWTFFSLLHASFLVSRAFFFCSRFLISRSFDLLLLPFLFVIELRNLCVLFFFHTPKNVFLIKVQRF